MFNTFFSTPILQKMTPAKLIFTVLLVIVVIFNLSPGFALAIGLLFGLFIPHPYKTLIAKANKVLLQVSVIGLGFAMDFHQVVAAGQDGVLFTTVSIVATILLGIMLGKLFRIDRVIAYLVSSGTAICGGSAIAAVSPVVKANDDQISVSIGIIFVLNTIALFIFPSIGHYFEMSQHQFGMWSAIAIHDTSSVVGASNAYGQESLMIATTVKLARALWIVPLVIVSSFIFRNEKVKFVFPFFILFFIIASLMRTYIPAVEENSANLLVVAKTGLAVCLYFIGTNISIASVKKIGFSPLLLGIILWLFISVISFYVIIHTIR